MNSHIYVPGGITPHTTAAHCTAPLVLSILKTPESYSSAVRVPASTPSIAISTQADRICCPSTGSHVKQFKNASLASSPSPWSCMWARRRVRKDSLAPSASKSTLPALHLVQHIFWAAESLVIAELVRRLYYVSIHKCAPHSPHSVADGLCRDQ
jgi:hypothetical protein